MAKRNAPKFSSRFLGSLLILSGVFFVSLSTLHRYFRWTSLRLDRQTVQAYLDQEAQSTPADPTLRYPVRIFIPGLIDLGIEPHVYAEGEWTISTNQASYLTASARPGESGNIIIYGHNKWPIFGKLTSLQGQEIITLYLQDGSERQYQIESLAEVAPTQTELLQPTATEVLTVYTCTGWLDSRRLVIRAHPLTTL